MFFSLRHCRILTIALTSAALAGFGRAARADAPAFLSPAPPQVRLLPGSFVGANGFFRVAKAANGGWWFVAPDGSPFFYRGVTAVNRAGTAGGRRAKPGPYALVVDRKYDYRKDPRPFVDAEIARLRSWGFNALGAWTTDEFFDRGMPYTEIVEFNYVGPSLTLDNVKGAEMDLPDVFDPAWERAADEKARLICAPRRASRDLVGYFTDNELGWAQPEGEDVDNNPKAALLDSSAHLTLLQECLSLDPARPTYRAAWDFVLSRHGGKIEETARAWNAPDLTETSVGRWTRASRALVSPGYRADCDAFSHEAARRYFAATARLIRKYDPNHLILGCRFGSEPGPAVLAECKRPWVDVLSANNYRDTMFERIEGYGKATGLPVLIGEFSWASNYFSQSLPAGSDPGGTNALAMPARMLRRGEATLERAATSPALVGYTWYRWDSKWDRAQPAKLPYGLVDMQDDPIGIHVDVLTRINSKLDERHSESGSSHADPP